MVSIISGGNFLRGIHWDSQNLNYRVPKGPKWGFFEKKFQKKFFFKKNFFWNFFLQTYCLVCTRPELRISLSKTNGKSRPWKIWPFRPPPNFCTPTAPPLGTRGPQYSSPVNNSIGGCNIPNMKKIGEIMVPPLVRLSQNAPTWTPVEVSHGDQRMLQGHLEVQWGHLEA